MTLIRRVLLVISLLMASQIHSHEEEVCPGFLPENNLRIPVSVFQDGGATKEEFEAVLDRVQAYYTPIIAALGGELRVNRNWESPVVNASANRSGSTYTINMYGGLARHPVMNKDGFMLVACHEIGHHIGGAPKYSGWFGDDWASNEGASDYFANLRCLRALFKAEDNAKFVEEQTIDPVLKTKCEEVYSTQEEEHLCMRAGMAGLTGALLFKAMREEAQPPKFDTPDANQVSEMFDDHPATQCRLDTYYQGTLCAHDMKIPLSDQDPNQGTCSEANGHKDGLRPRCWFKP